MPRETGNREAAYIDSEMILKQRCLELTLVCRLFHLLTFDERPQSSSSVGDTSLRQDQPIRLKIMKPIETRCSLYTCIRARTYLEYCILSTWQTCRDYKVKGIASQWRS